MEQVCQNCKSGFTIEKQDSDFHATMAVPPPTFCPQCRFQRRASHINTRNLYPRTLDGKQVVSMYSQDKQLNIVEDKDWWSDRYDFLSFGQDYDFARPFFTQFDDLLHVVPLPHLQRNFSTFENSDYCNAAHALKNCYLVINADFNEYCLYSFNIENCKHCTDIAFTDRSELCYQTLNVKNCYRCFFSEDCETGNNLHWCYDCVGCSDCFGCFGLRHKSYHLFNKPLSKEDYEREMARRQPGSWATQEKNREECRAFFLTKPRKYMHGRNNEEVTGDFLYQCRDVHDSFLVEKAEHCRYCQFLRYVDSGTHNAQDYTMFGLAADHVYECSWCGIGVNNIKFCIWNYGTSDCEYCVGCHNSQHLFGCIGLRHKKYCILNTQYTKEEYEELLPRIKMQMMEVPYVDTKGNIYCYGEFFPIELSPFAYNQTLAQDYCAVTKDEAIAQSYGWYDTKERVIPDATRWQDLPDDIADVAGAHTARPITCKGYDDDPTKALEHHCTQFFKIIPQELEFYKNQGIALPRCCHNCRYFERIGHINPFTLWTRQCGKCGEEIRTSYAPGRPEMVYCERCYLEATY